MEGSAKRKKPDNLIFTITEVTSVYPCGIRVYGRLKGSGKSVCAKTNVFRPYFYAHGQSLDLAKINEKLRVTFSNDDGEFVESIHSMDRIPLMGYHPNGSERMQCITMTSPKYVSTCREMLEHEGIPTYEGNVQFVQRYMVDKGIGGNDWVCLRRYRSTGDLETHCDIEVEFDSELERLPEESEVGLQRWLAFDIEACKGGSGRGFVNPLEDMVSQIGNTLFDSNYNVLDRRVFSMGGSVAKLPEDIQCEVFTDEATLLLAWRDYIIERDPDAFTGYNIDGFDWWYLFERAKKLKIYDKFRAFSKDLTRPATIKKATFSSTAKGARTDYEVNCEGRFNFDMLKFIKDSMKLRSYTLGNVSKAVLNDNKVEMSYENIPIYQAGTDEQRAHLCYYCWYDADLCRRLMQKRMAIVNYVETARVCGVPMKFLITRGQQVLTQSLLLRYAQRRNYVLPSSTESQNDEKTTGATVLDTLTKLYKSAIAVLDFASLYPSIIRDKNICYSTKTPLKWAQANLKPFDYFVPPITNCNYCYVKEHISVGLLAEIEETLFNKRLEAKADLKKETDPGKKDVLNGRQLAIKIRMNSIYGFLKANMICDKDLMETVTSVGRTMIEKSKEITEANFKGSSVIYGDTDSIFVNFGDETDVKTAFEKGERASHLCSVYFNEERESLGKKWIHNLQMEKVFKPHLQIGKKKYAGYKYLAPDATPFVDSSGLENVRRDNAKITSETLEYCLVTILKDGDLDGIRSITYVHNLIRDLLMGRVDISKLIISKNLSKTFKQYEETGSMLPHVELAKKIKARGDEEYHTGDRVKYVVVCGPKGSKSSELAEDPAYVLRNRLNIDYNYYIYNQLMKPLLRIFTPILAPGESMSKLNKSDKSVYINDKEISKLTAYKALFIGDHMMHKVQRVKEGTATGMMRFAKKLPKCVGCGCSTKNNHLCSSCSPRAQSIHVSLMYEKQALETQAWQAWTRCQVCVGDKHVHKIHCNNKDCDNFYQREKVIYDIEDLVEKLGKL